MQVTPYKSEESKKKQVETMFNNIAHRYDFLNQILSLGIHKLWRKKTISLIKSHISNPKIHVLDIATGTADFAIEALALKPEKIVGVDISEGMLDLGKKKIKEKKLTNIIELQIADSENLPFADNTFDAITVGFGVRNFENLEKGLKEIYRVMKPNAVVGILEFSKPKAFPIKQFYNFYFAYIMPFIGRIFSKDTVAYTYLHDSVEAFPEGNTFLTVMKNCGFAKTNLKTVSFGIATIYTAEK